MDFKELRSVRQKLVYTAFSTMPNILVYEADPTEPKKLMRKVLSLLKDHPNKNKLHYAYISPNRMEIVSCIVAAFASNYDYSSQIGVLVLKRDTKTKTVNVIHYRSSKTKRLCRSVLVAELLLHGVHRLEIIVRACCLVVAYYRETTSNRLNDVTWEYSR